MISSLLQEKKKSEETIRDLNQAISSLLQEKQRYEETIHLLQSQLQQQSIYSIPPKQEPPSSTIVYVTNTGSKYHRRGCQYLRSSCNPITLEEAKRFYTPCSVCW